jgi:hypothetical protein
LKSGIRTTELAVTILTDVGVVTSALQGSLSPKWAAIVAGIAQVAYAISRGLAKQGYVAPATVVVTDPGPQVQPADAAA